MGNRRKNAPLSHFCVGCIHLQSMVKTEIIHTSSYLLPGSRAHLWGPDSRFSPGIVPLPCPARGLRLQGTRQPGSELLWRSPLLYRLVKDTSSPEGSLLLTSTSHCHGNWFPLYERRRRSLALKHRLVQEEGGRGFFNFTEMEKISIPQCWWKLIKNALWEHYNGPNCM